MNSKERMDAAVACKVPDRIPIALRLDVPAAHWSGITSEEFMQDPWKASNAIEWVFDKFGGWDGVDNTWTMGVRYLKLDTYNMEIHASRGFKMLHVPTMTVEDYDVAIKEGLYGFMKTVAARMGKRFDPELETEMYRSFAPIYKHWEEKGAVVHRGGKFKPAMSHFQWARTWQELLKDLMRNYDKVKQACDAMFEEAVTAAEKQSRLVNCKYVFVPASKSTLGSKKLFEDLLFPYLKEGCHRLVKDGFVPRIHLDLDWTEYLEYLLELPKRSCIAELESLTDLKKAKEVLGGHMCISGGVPPGLLVRGTPDKVHETCKKLIEEMGPDGYILANDDMVPPNARMENVKALVDAGKKFGGAYSIHDRPSPQVLRA
ncbi:MAG: hypothetical protein HYY67_05330 [Thaumarchaeota archaeon]|nr:hypothetical protein [Nitrososphaerota archaeon]